MPPPFFTDSSCLDKFLHLEFCSSLFLCYIYRVELNYILRLNVFRMRFSRESRDTGDNFSECNGGANKLNPSIRLMIFKLKASIIHQGFRKYAPFWPILAECSFVCNVMNLFGCYAPISIFIKRIFPSNDYLYICWSSFIVNHYGNMRVHSRYYVRLACK